MPDWVEFDGFNEARKALGKLGDVDKTREYKVAGYEIASEIVLPAARANASTRLERRAAQSLEAVSLATGAAVRLGKGFPASFGAEFGSDRNQRRQGRPGGKSVPVIGWNQFKPWRGSDSGAGYFLYPAIRENSEQIVNRYTKLFDDLFGDDGPGG